MSLELDITVEREGDIAIVSATGELDDYNAPRLNDIFIGLIDAENFIKIVVNLESITYVDSVGLGAIAIAAKKAGRREGVLHIVCTKPQVMKLLNASGMVSIIKRNIGLFENLEEAKKAINAS